MSMKVNQHEVSKGSQGAVSRFLKMLGPGLITSALVLGPGSITLSSKIGAIYGTQLVWILVLAVILMASYTEMSARIGLAGKATFIGIVRERWGKIAAIFIGIGAFLVCASFQAGNAIGTGIAVEAITGVNSKVWIIVGTVLAVGLLFFTHFYKILEKLMLVLVIIMLLAFLITTIVVRPSLSDIFSGLIPALPEGSVGLIIALFATSFSIVGALYQSYLVREKGAKISQAKETVAEAFFGIFLLGFISFLIMITAAAVLKPMGIVVNNAIEMADILKPSFGGFAVFVFVLGLFGASFSSLVGNATIGGGLFADGVGLGHSLSNIKVKIAIIGVMLIGSIIALVFNGAPVNLIIFAQGVTIFVVPFIAVAILVIANTKSIMGDLKNGLVSNIFAIVGLLVLVYLAFNNFKNIFLG
ncbi:Nramp family divalent metal transporter [Bacillus ndiopicus]|uniref:Nramp family divalent metal transporter n=1 Tax=Bacillus ndiopicus TaxID=1347368 RepID=UPI000B25F6AF|nr:Nramp family divalent metal transporter [Bacillus ndiopicus]